jgi:hypothetical protein
MFMENFFTEKEGIDYEDASPPPKNGLPSLLYFPWKHIVDGKFIKWM